MDLSKLVGKRIEEAKSLIPSEYKCRVFNGKQVGTCDLRSDRVNLTTTKKGVVTKAEIG